MSAPLHMAVFALFSDFEGYPNITMLQQDRTWDSFEAVLRFAESQADQSVMEGRHYAAIMATAGSEMVVWRMADLLR